MSPFGRISSAFLMASAPLAVLAAASGNPALGAMPARDFNTPTLVMASAQETKSKTTTEKTTTKTNNGATEKTTTKTTTEKPATTAKPQEKTTTEKTTTTTTETKVVTESAAEDKMEDIQSFNTYTSLEDGQPGQRGEWQFNFFNGWETTSGEHDPYLMTLELEYSPNCPDSWLLSNAKFTLDVPLELGNGGVEGNGDLEFTWKQRIVEEKECEWWPTFTVENSIRVPSGYHSSGVDYTLEGVVAKNVGCGTAVLNAWAKSANGNNNLETASWWQQAVGVGEDDDLQHFQWGVRVGYKWRITDCFALIGDYVHQNNELEGDPNQNIGEVSAEWRVNDHLTIGPGIMFGLDGHETTPNFGAGVLVHYSW